MSRLVFGGTSSPLTLVEVGQNPFAFLGANIRAFADGIRLA